LGVDRDGREVTTVVISPTNVAGFPDGGGHFWVYMQYVEGLRRAGCRVCWLEEYRPPADAAAGDRVLATFRARMARHGLGGSAILYTRPARDDADPVYIDVDAAEAERTLARADLLLNFHYAIHPALLARFRRTALVDIDPGLLQHWMATDVLTPAPHDAYFTTGPTVGTPEARFLGAGVRWTTIRPPVALDRWPYVFAPRSQRFTTVSTWWGDEWVTDASGVYENNKRVSFLAFVGLPRQTTQPLELALYLGRGDEEDRRRLEANGWRVRHSREVAATPGAYARYIRSSRGEFSCVKPSCLKFRNGWMSDRSVCYLASGKPVVVQDTGQAEFLPTGEGMFTFTTQEEAAAALAAVNADYQRHCRAARLIAEDHFDARRTAETILMEVSGR
jgi:hypothetical protein